MHVNSVVNRSAPNRVSSQVSVHRTAVYVVRYKSRTLQIAICNSLKRSMQLTTDSTKTLMVLEIVKESVAK